MKLLYVGPFNLPTGYGQAARGYARALQRLGVNFQVELSNEELVSPLMEDLAGVRAALLRHPDEEPFTHVLIHAPPSTLNTLRQIFDPGYPVIWVAMTTWETDSLPEAFQKDLMAFSRVLVPSRACAKQMPFLPTRVVPHILETEGPEAWPPMPAQHPRENRPFTFLWHGDWSERKNPIGALRAFCRAFSAADDVQLVLKMSGPWDRLTVRSILDRCGKPPPAVSVIDQHLSHQELVVLYQTVDAFVTLSRGDAWGFPAFHAASQGLPVIYTVAVGHEQFLLHSPNAEAVVSRRTPACSAQTFLLGLEGGGVRVDVRAPDGVTVDQDWGDPSLSVAAHLMQRLYEEGYSRLEPDFLPRFSSESVGVELVSGVQDSRWSNL